MDLYVLNAILFGLIIGSFLSVCIYRIPIGKKWDEDGVEQKPEEADTSEPKVTLLSPARSFCFACRKQLKWWHNIPVVSWMFLGGKCGFCGTKISVRYPAVELLSALFSALSYQMYGFTPTGVLVYLFCAALIVISFIDYDYYIIPNVISLPGTVLGLGVALLNTYTGWFQYPVVPKLSAALLGIVVGAGFLLLISEFYFRLRRKEGLGMGDVKLLAMTGAFFGPACALYTIFIGSLLGSVLGILLILVSGRKISQQLPFGPYLALGTICYLFVRGGPFAQLFYGLTVGF
ncbi:MAG: prepilin peptidase [Oligoflexia bacterium]|nr:prepilin peptidase [Oligoflexia bacterium]